MSWTDERVELLKKLWMDGHSASQIAGQLGEGVTRNAVIGKVHRLKLSTRAKPAPSPARTRPVPRPPLRRPGTPMNSPGAPAPSAMPAAALASSPAPRVSAPAMTMMSKPRPMATAVVGATALAVTQELEVERVVTSAEVTELFIPEGQRLTLLQLTEKTCKWPVGDPLSSEFYFCGKHADEGHPYCEFHAKKAYHQIDKKRR